MGQQNDVSGPDFGDGVAISGLADGQPLLGHVGEDAVVLIRRGEEFFAIGANCTHWNGPLAEGAVTGDTIRCPWHHACFNIRSGDVVAAPALSSLPTWRTEVRGDRVFVGAKRTRPSSVLIMGAGAAGMMAAKTLLEEGFEGSLTLIDPDRDAPYDRPNLSKDYLAGNAPREWLPLLHDDLNDSDRVTRLYDAVTSIESGAVVVGGKKISFDALLIATGSSPIRLPIPGIDLPHVHLLRTQADTDRLIAALTDTSKVVVAGASFIGLEVATSLSKRGIKVTVAAPEKVPLQRVFGDEVGKSVQSLHEDAGVVFHLGRSFKEIRNDAVILDDGTVLDADVVVMGTGVRPNTKLAEDAGIKVDNGIVVDRYLETNIPGIYAAGDIARYPYNGELTRVEHWVVAQRQGQTVARNILGRLEPFESVPFFWTTQHDVAIAYVGHATAWDKVEINGDIKARECEIKYLSNGRTAAVATLNRDDLSLRAEIAMEARSSKKP